MAGGKGERLGTALPKQFLPLNGVPTILYSIKSFQEAIPGIDIILVIPKKHESNWQSIAKGAHIKASLAFGGSTRYQSVKNALVHIKYEAGIIAIHDAARPFITKQLIQNLFKAAEINGNAIPSIPIKDSIRQKKGDSYIHVDRNEFIAIQTPQCFKTNIILKAYKKEFTPSITDDAGLVESIGEEIHVIPGEEMNLKITNKQDLIVAESIAKKWQY